MAKSILDERDVNYEEKASVAGLVRLASEELRLVLEGVQSEVRASNSIRALLGNLASVVQRIAEIRSSYGKGHGKKSKTNPLRSRHAQLAVAASITVASFLFQTHEERK